MRTYTVLDEVQDIISMVGLVLLLAFAFNFFSIFYTAYFHPTKIAIVSVNSIGEADNEFILFTATIPVMIFAFIYLLRKRLTTILNAIKSG